MALEGYSIMERLIEIKQTELNPTLRVLSDAGVTVEDAAWIRQGNNASIVEDFIRRTRNRNPFEQSVDEQFAALRKQNTAGNWGIPEEVFDRLAMTAPAWPAGRDAHRSFTLRFGEGTEGMALTFEVHSAAIKRVHGEAKFWRWELLHSKPMPYQGKLVDRLRLLNGDATHHATVDWCIIPDLSAFRERQDITSVRGPKSLADEGLVLAWLNPKRVEAIDYKGWCAWYCGGYEANVPEDDGEGWRDVVVVDRNADSGEVSLRADWRSYDGPGCSVPSLG